jgi:hypothetical protein
MTQKTDLELRIKEVLEEPREFPVIEITDKEFIEDLFKNDKRGLLSLCDKYKEQMNIEKAYWTLFDDYSLFITKQPFYCAEMK